jgi:hypothetical protein
MLLVLVRVTGLSWNTATNGGGASRSSVLHYMRRQQEIG